MMSLLHIEAAEVMSSLLEVLERMNIFPVITLFGGLAAFFTLAITLRYAAGKTQMIGKQNDNQLTGS